MKIIIRITLTLTFIAITLLAYKVYSPIVIRTVDGTLISRRPGSMMLYQGSHDMKTWTQWHCDKRKVFNKYQYVRISNCKRRKVND